MVRVPGINYDRPVQSLGRHSIELHINAARAQGQALADQGRARAAQLEAASKLTMIGYGYAEAEAVGKLNTAKFNYEQDRLATQAFDSLVRPAFQIWSELSARAAEKEYHKAMQEFQKGFVKEVTELSNQPTRVEVRENREGRVISRSDSHVSDVQASFDKWQAEVMSKIKHRDAKDKFLVSSNDMGIKAGAAALEQSIKWKNEDDFRELSAAASEYVRQGQTQQALDIYDKMWNWRLLTPLQYGALTEKAKAGGEEIKFYDMVNRAESMGRAGLTVLQNIQDRLKDPHDADFGHIGMSSRGPLQNRTNEAATNIHAEFIRGKIGVTGPNTIDGIQTIEQYVSGLENAGYEAAGYDSQTALRAAASSLRGMSSVTKAELKAAHLAAETDRLVDGIISGRMVGVNGVQDEYNTTMGDIKGKDVADAVYAKLVSQETDPAEIARIITTNVQRLPTQLKDVFEGMVSNGDPSSLYAVTQLYEEFKVAAQASGNVKMLSEIRKTLGGAENEARLDTSLLFSQHTDMSDPESWKRYKTDMQALFNYQASNSNVRARESVLSIDSTGDLFRASLGPKIDSVFKTKFGIDNASQIIFDGRTTDPRLAEIYAQSEKVFDVYSTLTLSTDAASLSTANRLADDITMYQIGDKTNFTLNNTAETVLNNGVPMDGAAAARERDLKSVGVDPDEVTHVQTVGVAQGKKGVVPVETYFTADGLVTNKEGMPLYIALDPETWPETLKARKQREEARRLDSYNSGKSAVTALVNELSMMGYRFPFADQRPTSDYLNPREQEILDGVSMSVKDLANIVVRGVEAKAVHPHKIDSVRQELMDLKQYASEWSRANLDPQERSNKMRRINDLISRSLDFAIDAAKYHESVKRRRQEQANEQEYLFGPSP